MKDFRVGTAAWSIPKESSAYFPGEDSHLERYARRLRGVEINSSFYRDHLPSTYRRWAAAVPADFRFALKLTRDLTHAQRLRDPEEMLERVWPGPAELGDKLAVILVQLPPSLRFELPVARHFFSALRARFRGGVAFEPRHRSWLAPAALELLRKHEISKVIADPEPCPLADADAVGDTGLAYYRLHGSPVMYQSDYPPPALAEWRQRMEASRAREVWGIFDNTTFGYATLNALELDGELNPLSRSAAVVKGIRTLTA